MRIPFFDAIRSRSLSTYFFALVLCAGCRFQLDRTLGPGEIRGRVVVGTTNGTAPAVGAAVQVLGSVIHVNTDAQGRFLIRNLGPGVYSLSLVYAPQGAGHPDSILALNVPLDAQDGVDLGTIQLAVAGSIKGRVYLNGVSGPPVPGAALSIVDTQGHTVPGIPVARSDGNGEYELPYVLAGTAVVKALYLDQDGNALTSLSQPVTIQPRVQARQDLLLSNPTPAMDGSIVAKATYSQPLTSVTAQVTAPGRQPIQVSNVSPNAIVVATVPAGIYTLTVQADGLEPVVVSNIVVDGNIDLGTLVFSQPIPPPNQPTDCNDNGVFSCVAGQTSGCDTDDDSDGIPDAQEDQACLCRAGGKLEQDGSCGPLDPCAEAMCDANAMCSAPDGIRTCTCDAGYVGDGLSCTDIDECKAGTATCDSHATCTNTPGSYTCACSMGYTGDGFTCLDAQECEDGTATCDANATCTDSPGSFACACNSGWSGDGMTCTDIDECKLGTATCDVNATCANTPGSFSCTCNPGYVGAGMTCAGAPPVFTSFTLFPNPVPKYQEVPRVAANVRLDSTVAVSDVQVALTTLDGQSIPFSCSANEVPNLYNCQLRLQGGEAPMGKDTFLTVTAVATGTTGGTAMETASLEFDYRPQLNVDQTQLQYVHSPGGNTAKEDFGNGATIPAGPYYALTAPDSIDAAKGTFVPGTTISSTAFTLDTTAVAAIHVWSDAKGTQQVGTAAPDADGGCPVVSLDSKDAPVVYVSAVDQMGDESAPQKITSEVYVATPNEARQPLTGLISQQGTLDPPASVSVALTGPYGSDQNGVIVSTSLPWVQRTNSVPPPQHYGGAMAFDVARERAVYFGGYDAAGVFSQDVWEWDGSTWTEIPAGTTAPSARTLHRMTYDSFRNRVVLFGGQDESGKLVDDIWEWDGKTWAQQMPLDGVTPGGRSEPALTFDATLGGIVLFGGRDGSGAALGDIWFWDGTYWTQRFASTLPAARFGASMVYAPALGGDVLYGGVDAGFNPLAETWLWNGSDWVQSPTQSSPPPGYYDVAMTYDWTRRWVLLFGGAQAGGSSDEFWYWDGSNWTQLQLPASAPGARQEATLVYDPLLQQGLLVGGYASGNPISAPVDDTWRYSSFALPFQPGVGTPSGPLWTDVTPSPSTPSARSGHSMAFDTQRHVTLLFGGQDSSTGMLLGDFWQWDGNRWTQLKPTGSTPPPRRHAAMVFDGERDVTVLYGGEGPNQTSLHDVWEWDGTSWTNPTPQGPSPTACCEMATGFHPTPGVTFFFGGADATLQTASDETWSWDGATWRLLATQGMSPSARRAAAMAYDDFHGYLVMQGGYVGGATPVASDTWTFDGYSWTASAAPGSPGPLFGATMMQLQNPGSVVLFGGETAPGTDATAQLWQWSSSGWQALSSPQQPPARHDHAGAFDSDRGVVVLFGGTSNATPGALGDLWELNASGFTSPAIQFDAQLASEGIQPLNVSSVVVRANCGAVAYGDGTLTGATLNGWKTGSFSTSPGWSYLTSNGVGVASTPPYLPAMTTPLIWISTSQADALSVLQQRDARASFECVSSYSGSNDGLEPSLASNYMEIRVQYSVP